ncbi:hypothetical protein CMI48_00575 [Candidatus Pacearchaeota archaeon]|nr:hypothetical protein [Candidatus Pacearchaeota archaeon]
MAEDESYNKASKGIVWLVIIVMFLVVIGGVGFGIDNLGIDKLGEKVLQFAVYGSSQIDTELTNNTVTGEIGAIITVMMFWLILFVAFGDIFENFSAFSSGIGWIIAFAIAVISANLGLIKSALSWIVAIFAWAGTAAVLLSLFASIAAFFAVNWGIGPLTSWLKTRQKMTDAARGRSSAASGLKTMRAVDRASRGSTGTSG